MLFHCLSVSSDPTTLTPDPVTVAAAGQVLGVGDASLASCFGSLPKWHLGKVMMSQLWHGETLSFPCICFLTLVLP